jgi:cobalt-zinc-cadmium efflux system protein
MHQHSANCHHAHHSCHSVTASREKQAQLAIALLLIVTFALVELIVGLTSHSMALVAESGHMATDSFALLLALLATWLTQVFKAKEGGNLPMETGAAFINGIVLVAIALWIGLEVWHNWQAPPVEIASFPVLVTACVGTAVNGVNVALLHQGSDHDLNLKAAFLHVLADTLSSIGVLVAAIAIATLHWLWADKLISLLVAGLIFISAIPLVLESGHSLFQLNRQNS